MREQMTNNTANSGPGHSKIIAGGLVEGDGFYGEVSSAETGLWTGDELAIELGLTAGTSQYSNEPYLKFQLDGSEILYVPKKPFRNNITGNAIQAVNAIHGDRIIEKDGFRYAVTLLKGAGCILDIGNVLQGHEISWTHGSEWNRLMHPVHENFRLLNQQSTQQWGHYTDSELLTHRDFGSGSYSWCQESFDSGRRVMRGYDGFSYASINDSSVATSLRAWRPALRLIR